MSIENVKSLEDAFIDKPDIKSNERKEYFRKLNEEESRKLRLMADHMQNCLSVYVFNLRRLSNILTPGNQVELETGVSMGKIAEYKSKFDETKLLLASANEDLVRKNASIVTQGEQIVTLNSTLEDVKSKLQQVMDQNTLLATKVADFTKVNEKLGVDVITLDDADIAAIKEMIK